MLLMRCVVCAWPHRHEMQCALVLSCLGEQSTGGNLDFVYGTDKVGMPRWAETAKSDIAFDKWDWHRPAYELRNTHSSAKLADRLLRGEGMSGCTGGKCALAPDLSASGWGYGRCCLVAVTKAPDVRSLDQRLEREVADSVDYRTLRSGCKDQLDPTFSPVLLHTVFAAFADILPKDMSCQGSHASMHA